MSKNQIRKSINGRNSVANLQKTMIYITHIDLVIDYVYAKLGLYRSICFQDIEQKPNSGINQGPKLCWKFSEIRTHPSFHVCPRFNICKNEEDQIENEGARLFTRFSHY